MNTGIQSTDTELARRTADTLLHELHTHQVELEMQNEQLRQSQLELEQSRDRYVDFYDFAPVGYLTISHDGVITEINLTGAALLGVARGKLLQRRFAPFIAPSDRNRWDRFFISVLKKDHKLSCELKFEHGDKSCLYAQLDCQQLNKDGHETVVRVSISDITERKQLEQARQEILERFLRMTRLVPGIVYQFLLRPNGSTSMPYASDALHRIFKLNPAEVRKDASKMFNLVHPDDLESLMASIQASARTLTPWQHEFRIKHDDGVLCWLYGDSLPEREADGSTLWHGFLTDITGRRLAEQKLLTYSNETELRNRILKLISQDLALPELLDKMVREIEALHPEIRCAIMLLDEHRKRLRLCAAPGLPDDYRAGLDNLTMNHGNCSCWEAVRSGKRIDVANIQLYGCKSALQVGMQSCCSQPILDKDSRIHGIFTLYHPQPLLPSATEISSLEHYANLVMLAIEREQARLVSHSERELKAYQAAARRYAAHLETMREEEKNAFAREMHDDLGSTLTALRMEAYLLTKKLSAHQDVGPLTEHTETMMQLIDNTKVAMRRIIIGLRPSILDDFGLKEALEWHAVQFHKHSGIECRVNCIINGEKELGKAHPINLFRIFQEALTNVARHSGATLVEIEFHHTDSEIMLSVSDNGCGAPENHAIGIGSFGMVGMSERAAHLGGKISFCRPSGGGFCVTVNLPLS